MKTIFIPIFMGHQARNVLQTDIFKELKKNLNNRIVIFTKSAKEDLYRQKYGATNVIIEPIEYGKTSRLETFFINLALISVDTETIKRRQLKEYYRRGNLLGYWLKRIFIKITGNLKIFQSLIRLLDQKYVYKDILEKYFEKYGPDLVFSPHVLGKFDVLFLKTAKKAEVKNIAMANSWDNLSSRGMMRIFPDKLLVHNQIIKQEAIKLNGYPEESIEVVGMPHFDLYLSAPFSSKEEFYKRNNIPLHKEIILFCPAGSRMNDTEWQVIKMLDNAIRAREINFAALILVRQPPNAELVIGDLKEGENVTIDRVSQRFDTGDPNDWEWSKEDTEHLADSIFYSTMVLNYASTMSIDAAALNKPIINIRFDGWENKHKKDSFSWFYHDLTHYKNISITGGICSVYSIEELVNTINSYHFNPKLDEEGRRKIVTEQCWRYDGKSGKRVSEIIQEA